MTATPCSATAAWSAAAPSPTLSIDDIIRLMVGRQVNALFAHRERTTGNDVVLRVEGLNRRGNAQDQNATVLADVGFEVRRGEILGIAGLVGAGRTEMARAVFGADPFDSGRVIIDGREVHIRSPQDAIRHGIGLVPEDRKQQALFLALTVRTNLSMASHQQITRWGVFIDEAAERAMVEEYRKTLNIRMASPEQLIASLSGGNQQKVDARSLVGAAAEGAHRRRTDARHRCRSQGRGP